MNPEELPIDLETYAIENRPVPAGKRYKIRVDAQHFIVESPITGKEILALVGKSTEEWDVIIKLHPHGQRVVGAAEPVDLTRPGVERFVTMKRQVTDGQERPNRRQATLRSSDAAFLDSLGNPWEVIKDGPVTLVLIDGVPLPDGLETDDSAGRTARLCLRLEAAYPDTQIDMASFFPHLRRSNGRAIPNVSPVVVDGVSWQQWSRHRADTAAWRPAIDGVDTHFEFVQSWLRRELSR